MLSTAQLEHLHLHRYVVVPNWLSVAQTAALQLDALAVDCAPVAIVTSEEPPPSLGALLWAPLTERFFGLLGLPGPLASLLPVSM